MRWTRRGKLVVVLTILLVLLATPAFAGFLYLRSIGVLGSSDPGSRVEVEIPEGASASEIGRLLAEADVVPSAFGFRIALYFDGSGNNIQAGTYRLRTGLVARDALDELEKGPVLEFVTVTFPEGSWLEDFARILERDTQISATDFMQALESGTVRSRYQPDRVDILEGLLFPSTYQIVEEDDARSVATRLAETLEERVDALDASRLDNLGVSPYDAIIVASMVEAEAKVPGDRKKIAAVIYNRLAEGMALGIDATVLYALGEHKETLTRSDLQVNSPYNTRRFAGLPPTPIGAPGGGALEAAFDPAGGEWLYYVLTDCEGRHSFSVNYQDFLRDKATYQGLTC